MGEPPELPAEAIEPDVEDDDRGLFGLKRDRVELIATILLAAAAILTAWSAFQAGKWSGVQAVSFSEAGAARTESTRFDTRAGQQASIDISLFTDWLAALNDELSRELPVISEAGTYTPIDGTLSAFLFVRFREEFSPAMTAWLATDPANNPDAPPTPFATDEYVLAAAVQADELKTLADEKAAQAREANQIGDTYVLTAVLFATVLFFAGVSSKLERRSNRNLTLGVGVVVLVIAGLVLLSLPIELGDELFFLSD